MLSASLLAFCYVVVPILPGFSFIRKFGSSRPNKRHLKCSGTQNLLAVKFGFLKSSCQFQLWEDNNSEKLRPDNMALGKVCRRTGRKLSAEIKPISRWKIVRGDKVTSCF